MSTRSAYSDAVAVTLSDSLTFSPPLRALYVGTAAPGTLKVTTEDGNDVSFGAVVAGALIPLAVIKVWSTGTSVSNVVGLR